MYDCYEIMSIYFILKRLWNQQFIHHPSSRQIPTRYQPLNNFNKLAVDTRQGWLSPQRRVAALAKSSCLAQQLQVKHVSLFLRDLFGVSGRQTKIYKLYNHVSFVNDSMMSAIRDTFFFPFVWWVSLELLGKITMRKEFRISSQVKSPNSRREPMGGAIWVLRSELDPMGGADFLHMLVA